MVLLIVVSVVLLVLGFAAGWKEGNVDTLLTWTYVMVGLALAAVIIVGLIVGAINMNDPKSLVKLGIGLVVVAAVCFAAYLIAPGAPAMGMLQQPSAATLKLTDTILYLTYFAGIVAVLAIVVGEIRLAITNKKG